MRYFKIK